MRTNSKIIVMTLLTLSIIFAGERSRYDITRYFDKHLSLGHENYHLGQKDTNSIKSCFESVLTDSSHENVRLQASRIRKQNTLLIHALYPTLLLTDVQYSAVSEIVDTCSIGFMIIDSKYLNSNTKNLFVDFNSSTLVYLLHVHVDDKSQIEEIASRVYSKPLDEIVKQAN